jgi:hypothetical protein
MTTIHQEALISAVALTIGMNIGHHDPVFDWAEQNGWGGLELYRELGQVAALSYDLMTKVAACPDFAFDGFPGVYAYETDEDLGAWLAQVMRSGELPTSHDGLAEMPKVKHQLGELALDFFDKAQRPIPHAESIIKELTGYERAVVAVQVVPIIEHDDEVEPQFAGPDEKTTGWGIYDRLADGTARWHRDALTETVAMSMGRARADNLGVAIEPQPWKESK